MSWLSLIPMPSLAVVKAVGIAAVLAVTFAGGWSVNGWRIHSETQAQELQRRTDATQAERENRRTETLRNTNVIEAQNAQAKRTQTLALAAAAARTESDGLRSDIAAARAELPSRAPDACPDYAAATDGLLDAVAAGVTRLSAVGADIAAKANGHASDAMTLQQAWPK